MSIIGKFHALLTKHSATDTWIVFGTGKNFAYIHINAFCNTLRKCKSMSLPIFYCFTGCDTTEVSMGDLEFISRGDPSLYLHDTAVLYDNTSSLESVNEQRRELFCQKNRTMENIPPTQDALLQHSKHVAYQSEIWTTSDLAQQQTPSLEGHGWTFDRESQSWLPVWSTPPLSSIACSELVKCGCKSDKGCCARCLCRKVQ